jgi:hypothetical protein
MKNYFILILFFILILHVNGQKISLKTIYPEPRVGQSFSITLELDFIKDYFEKTLPNEMKFKSYSAFSNFSHDINVNETGNFTIGPLEFEFNGNKYWTDTLIINVIEKLEAKEGIWIRLMNVGNTQFVVIEQHIDNNWEIDEVSQNSFSMSISPENAEFAELIENPIEGLEFYNRQSSTSSISKDGENTFGVSLAYSRKIYRITNETGKEIKLTDKFFKNLPLKAKIPRLKIKTSHNNAS